MPRWFSWWLGLVGLSVFWECKELSCCCSRDRCSCFWSMWFRKGANNSNTIFIPFQPNLTVIYIMWWNRLFCLLRVGMVREWSTQFLVLNLTANGVNQVEMVSGDMVGILNLPPTPGIFSSGKIQILFRIHFHGIYLLLTNFSMIIIKMWNYYKLLLFKSYLFIAIYNWDSFFFLSRFTDKFQFLECCTFACNWIRKKFQWSSP